MKVVVNRVPPSLQLHWPSDLRAGTVYSWGEKLSSYLQVPGGAVCLSGTYAFISETTHNHFAKLGGAGFTVPWVEIATDVTLTLNYEV